MTETIRYGLIGKQDIRLGTGTFEVELSDGRVVTLSELDIAYLVSDATTKANLGSASPAGRIRRTTDDLQELVFATGSVWASLLARRINAENFGFSDTATAAANATALTNAIAAVPTRGGIILLPQSESDFPLTSVSFPTNRPIWILGTGPLGTRIAHSGTAAAFVYPGSPNLIPHKLGGLRINSTATAACIDLTQTNNFTIHDVIVAPNTSQRGITATNGVHLFIDRVFAEAASGDYGLYLDDVGGVMTTVRVRDSRFADAALAGVYCKQASGVLFDGVTFEGNVGRGLTIDGSLGVTARSCWFESNGIAGDILITNVAATPRTPTISDSVFATTSMDQNIDVVGGRKPIFSFNHFRATTLTNAAIRLQASSDRAVLIANHYDHTTDGKDVSDSGVGTTRIAEYPRSTTKGGSLVDMEGISNTTTRAKNLRGSVTIAGTSTSASVSFATAEPNNTYFLTGIVSSKTGAPAAGAFDVNFDAKLATGFTVQLQAAPGAGTDVTIDWMLIR